MSIKSKMESKILELNKIIKGIPNNPFDSHDFIQRFAKEYEKEYIEFLNEHKNSVEPFRTVHAQIGRFLADNQDGLDIKDNGETYSENVFGNKTPNESWIKI